MSRLRFLMTVFGCLLAFSGTAFLSATEFPEKLVEDLSSLLRRNVTAQLAGCTVEEETSEVKPLEIDGVSVGTYQEGKQIDAAVIAESLTLRIGGIRINDKSLGVDIRVGCEIAGKAHYIKAGPIPISLKSGYVARVIVKGRLTAKVDSTDSNRPLSDFDFTKTQLEIRGIQWSEQNIDLLEGFIRAAVLDRLQKGKQSALIKLNDDLTGLTLSESFLFRSHLR